MAEPQKRTWWEHASDVSRLWNVLCWGAFIGWALASIWPVQFNQLTLTIAVGCVVFIGYFPLVVVEMARLIVTIRRRTKAAAAWRNKAQDGFQ